MKHAWGTNKTSASQSALVESLSSYIYSDGYHHRHKCGPQYMPYLNMFHTPVDTATATVMADKNAAAPKIKELIYYY